MIERNTHGSDNAPDNEYAWFRDGNAPQAREDLLSEVIAFAALLFALGIGLVIAMLPVSAKAANVAAAPAAASAPAGPSLELTAFKVVPALPGKPERLVPADQARTGDTLEYQAVYRNPTAVAVHKVLVTVPVPAKGVEYVLESASPKADLASADGQQYKPLPLQRIEPQPDGRQLVKPAPGADYKFLRWNLGDVPAGEVRTVRTRVHLVPSTVAAR